MKNLKIIALIIAFLATISNVSANSTNLVWWDRDEHWCIGSAWYIWSESASKCIRPWEENSENKICTMEYAPVCAEVQVQCIKAPCYPITQTFWNTCSAWNNKVLYTWECSEYLDWTLLKKLEKFDSKMQKLLKNKDKSILERALKNATEQIEMVKKSRITTEVQIERITKITYVQRSIEKELYSR